MSRGVGREVEDGEKGREKEREREGERDSACVVSEKCDFTVWQGPTVVRITILLSRSDQAEFRFAWNRSRVR